MLFKTSDKHEEFRAKVRAFAEKEVKPYAFQWDEGNVFPRDVVKKMAKLGFMGIPTPKEYGGQGCDTLPM